LFLRDWSDLGVVPPRVALGRLESAFEGEGEGEGDKPCHAESSSSFGDCVASAIFADSS
jgi:hypothetical protein